MAKFAIIINGDTRQDHLVNVERSLKVLEGQGYQTWVASPITPNSPHDFYFDVSRVGVHEIIDGVKQSIGPDDELVIYTTGHGSEEGVCLEKKKICNTEDLFVQLRSLPYSRRVVVMDQCLGGNFGKLFLADPRTLFISTGSRQESVCCEQFAPFFWSEKVPDSNGDRVISWQERYDFAVSGRIFFSTPQFVPSPQFVDDGTAPFSTIIRKIGTETDFDNELMRLKQGQYAFKLFSLPDNECPGCKIYKPKYREMAEGANGQHLWLMTENEDLADKYGITVVPTVMIFGADGSKKLITNRDRLMEELSQYHVPWDVRLEKRIQTLIDMSADDINDSIMRHRALIGLGYELVYMGQVEKAKQVFERMISDAEKKPLVPGQLNVRYAILDIARPLAQKGFIDEALFLFERVFSSVKKMKDLDLARGISSIASKLGRLRLGDKTLPLFIQLLSIAGKRMDDVWLREDPLYAVGLYLDESRATHKKLKSEVLPVFERIATATDEIDDDAQAAKGKAKVALSMQAAGLKSEGRIVLREAITDAEKIDELTKRADALRYIAYEMRGSGYYLPYNISVVFKKSISAARKIGDPLQRINSLRQIAWTYRQRGFKRKALNLFRECTGIAKGIDNRGQRAVTLKQNAWWLARADLEKEALSTFEESVSVAKEVKEPHRRAEIFIAIAYAVGDAQIADKAQPVFEELFSAVDMMDDTEVRDYVLSHISHYRT